jgi:hypothetical protein
MLITLRGIIVFWSCSLCMHIAWSQATSSAAAAPSVALPASSTCGVLDPELQTRYEGPCSGDGWAHGIGKATGARAVYEGRFVFGAKQGVGTKTWADTGDQYVGEFFQDARQGKGTYTWGDASSSKGSRYTGQFYQDLRQGQGSFYWGNGDFVHGQWSQGTQLAPATPMQSLQIMHLQSMAKTLAVGQQVCQDNFAPHLQKQAPGTIVSRDNNRLDVRLDSTQNTAQLPIPTISAIAWWPC